MSYAILCDARAGGELGIDALGLVDRSKTRDLWWTSDDPGLLLIYRNRSAAEHACRRLRMNSPRVVPAAEAVRLLQEQRNEIICSAAMDDIEAGWGGHKVWTGGQS